MTEDQIQTLEALHQIAVGKWDSAAIDALRAALTLAGQTCGSCKHCVAVWPSPTPRGRCTNDQAPAYQHVVRESDGCRLGWAPKKDSKNETRTHQ